VANFTFTIDTENPEDVRLVEAFLELMHPDQDDDVVRETMPTSVVADESVDADAIAWQMVDTLYGRFGSKSREYVLTAAQVAKRDGSFTLESLAKEIGVTREIVRRWRYGLGRSLKRIKRDMPTAPPLFTGNWDGKRQVYTMQPEVRDAILARYA
jgi:hypothetical protein